jgi:hypothetical protein
MVLCLKKTLFKSLRASHEKIEAQYLLSIYVTTLNQRMPRDECLLSLCKDKTPGTQSLSKDNREKWWRVYRISKYRVDLVSILNRAFLNRVKPSLGPRQVS